MTKVATYAKLLHIPGLGGLAIPPVIGALTVGVYDINILVILFIIGSFSVIFGFVLNDYADVELDRLVKELQKKPLVSGEVSRKNAVAISVFCIMFAFLFAFILWRGTNFDDFKFAAILCIILAGVLGSIYNLYGKKIAGSDFLVAISMAFVFLFGALAVGEPTLITWVVFLLTFNQTIHMNAVEGGIKDSDHDHIMGVKNIALSSGVKVSGNKITIPSHFKVFGMGIRLLSAFLVFVPFVFYNYDYYLWQIIILALVTLIFLYFSAKLISIKKFDRSKIRKFIGIQSFLRYSIVPIMLISIIGLTSSVILIIFPIVWYIVFTPLLGEKLFRPRM